MYLSLVMHLAGASSDLAAISPGAKASISRSESVTEPVLLTIGNKSSIMLCSDRRDLQSINSPAAENHIHGLKENSVLYAILFRASTSHADELGFECQSELGRMFEGINRKELWAIKG